MKITEENCPSAVQTDIQFCASTEQKQKKGRKVIGESKFLVQNFTTRYQLPSSEHAV